MVDSYIADAARDLADAAVSNTDASATTIMKAIRQFKRPDASTAAQIRRWQVSPENSLRPPIPALAKINHGIKYKAYTGRFNDSIDIPAIGSMGVGTGPFIYRMGIQPWVADQPICHFIAEKGAFMFGPAIGYGHDNLMTQLDTTLGPPASHLANTARTDMAMDFELAGEIGFMAGVPGYTDGPVVCGQNTNSQGVTTNIFGVAGFPGQTGYSRKGTTNTKLVIVRPGAGYVGDSMEMNGLNPPQYGSGWGVKAMGFTGPIITVGNLTNVAADWVVAPGDPATFYCNNLYLTNILGVLSAPPIIDPLNHKFTCSDASPDAWPFSSNFAVAAFEGGYIEAEITIANGASCRVACSGSNQIRNFGMHTLDGSAGGACACAPGGASTAFQSSSLHQLKRSFKGDIWVNQEDFYFDDLACTAGSLASIAGYDNVVMGADEAKTFYYAIPYAFASAGLCVLKSSFAPEYTFSQYYMGAFPGQAAGDDAVPIYVDMSGDPLDPHGAFVFPADVKTILSPSGTDIGILYPDNGRLGVSSMWESQAGIWYASYGSAQSSAGSKAAYPQSTYPQINSSNTGMGILTREDGAFGIDDRGGAVQGCTIVGATRIVRACNSLAQCLYAGMPQFEVENTTPVALAGAKVQLNIKGMNFFNAVCKEHEQLYATATSNAVLETELLWEGRNMIRPAVGRSSESSAMARRNMRAAANNIRRNKGVSQYVQSMGALAIPSTEPLFNASSGIEPEQLSNDKPGLSFKTVASYISEGLETAGNLAAAAASRLGLGALAERAGSFILDRAGQAAGRVVADPRGAVRAIEGLSNQYRVSRGYNVSGPSAFSMGTPQQQAFNAIMGPASNQTIRPIVEENW